MGMIKKNYKLMAVLLVAAFFIFYRIPEADIIGDAAVYSTRAVGLVDTMFTGHQSTPLDWFDIYPWWANLSHHDHPPLLLGIQHFFLSIYESSFFAKLPYALFGLGTIIVIFLWVKKEFGEPAALLSSILLILNSGFIWSARTTYLEAGVVFFISLTLLAFSVFLDNRKTWLFFGISLGLLLLTKYTALFIIPSLLIYLIFCQRDVLRDKKLYYSLLLAIAIFSPIILYNIMMYKTVGHFDLQLSRLFSQDTPWDLSGPSFNKSTIIQLFFNLGYAVSYPYLIIGLLALIYSVYREKKMYLIASCFIFLTIMLCVVGLTSRFMVLYSVFLSIPIAYTINVIFKRLKKRDLLKKAYIIFISIFAIYLAFFVANSHYTFTKPIGRLGYTFSSPRSQNLGLYQLDTYLGDIIRQLKEKREFGTFDVDLNIKKRKKSLVKYASSSYSVNSPEELKHIFVYDGNIDWFVKNWLFMRRVFYDNVPFIELDAYYVGQEVFSDETVIHFIKSTSDTLLEPFWNANDHSLIMQSLLLNAGVEPDLIYRSDGKVAFRVYHIDKSKTREIND